MTSRELVVKTLNHEPAPRVPRDLWISAVEDVARTEELAEINASLVAAGVGLALAEEVRTSLHEVYFAIAERQGQSHA